MTTALTYLALIAIMIAPMALLATLATLSRRSGILRIHLDQFRFSAPMVGPLYEERRR
jgi:hypothetical protein